MYDIKIDRGRNSVHLSPEYGYYVKSIDGLTGISASFDSVKAINGYGESITGKTIPPKSLVITGVVLDGNTTAKQALLDVLLAGEEVLVTIYQGYTSDGGSQARPSAYRQTKAFVKQSPIITQERHSKFSFTLTMPNPYWEGVTASTITVIDTLPVTAPTITGDVPPEFEFEYTNSADSYGATLYCGASLNILNAKYLYFNYTLLSDGYLPAGSKVHLWRENGRLRLTRTDNNVINENIIQALYTSSTLWYLPVGNANKYWMFADGSFTGGKINYKPLYSGVLVDGV